MMVDPGNRLVADTLERGNEKLRTLAQAQEDREQSKQHDRLVIDGAIRKRPLAYVIEDATLIKHPAEGTTTIHLRFKGGKTEALTVQNPKSSAQQVKAPPQLI